MSHNLQSVAIITYVKALFFSFDVGNVLATEECAIGPDVTRSELSEQMSKIGAKLMVKVINDLHSFRESSQPQQPTTEITYGNNYYI